jgi:hypothetical protein
VRGLPSKTVAVQITNSAPVPAAPTQVAPAAGASVSLPFTFDWTDTANPQVAGYDLDVDTDPNFGGEFGVLLIQNITRSDYMLASDLPPGSYFGESARCMAPSRVRGRPDAPSRLRKRRPLLRVWFHSG